MFKENVLLKIKRDYSKDEATAVLLKELSDAKFKIGELTSEIEELKGEIIKLRMIPTSNGKTKRQWLQDEIFTEVNETNKKNRKINNELRRELQTYKDKYFILLAKQNNQKEANENCRIF